MNDIPNINPVFPNQSLLNIHYPEIFKVFKQYEIQKFLKQHSANYKKTRENGLDYSLNNQDLNNLQFVKLQKINLPEVQKNSIKKIKNEKLDNKLIWYFEGNQGPEWQNFLEYVSESSCQRLIFFCMRLKFNENIHKVITSISYSSLIVLTLSACPITNLESIQFLNAPVLRCLYIRFCKVTNIRSLVKTNFKNLSNFCLTFHDDCSVNNLNPLPRMYFRQSIDEYSIFKVSKTYTSLYDEKKYELNDLKFLLKFQLNKDGVNQLAKKGLKDIIDEHELCKNQLLQSFATINQAYEREGMPERVVEHQIEKMLLDHMLEKLHKWINK